ncbi:S8 family serine peptidase [Nocardiopsis sp. YSL2]|uniref:S8 family serine peptidase n=1 Tax=Nocardiopsis sp. YSL2 TaxID=2939492 RepID=UPI0026F47AE6|nr:S8 family serine peptidase [Nocardiopsis sp. YSL2]
MDQQRPDQHRSPRGRRPRRAAAPARLHRRLRGIAASLLAFGPLLAPAAVPAPAWADEPAALPQVTQFKGADDACAEPGADVVERVPWTFPALGLASAHELSRGGGVSVAVLATGVDGRVPALAGAVAGGGSEDCLGYGTFLAGVVAARPVPGSGFVGVAPQAAVVPVPTGDADTGIASPDDLASGLGAAVDAEARVVLVGTAAVEGSDALDEAVAAAAEAGVLVVAPATVLTSEGPAPGHPAQDPAVLSVAAHDADGAPVLAEPLVRFDGELARVDVTAPGDRVLSVGPGGEGHVTAGGDGVAAAFAAGTAVLLASREPDAGPEEIRERLTATAYGSPLGPRDPVVGSGRIDPPGALSGDPVAAAEAGAAVGAGEPFVPDPSPRGSVRVPPTVAAVGGAGLVVVLCSLAGAVLRNGRTRGWRPASAGERVTPEEDPRPLI